jgi:hypothetical protein
MNPENLDYKKSFILFQNERRKKKMAEVKQTEGWSKLSQRQQKLIEISLFAQDRYKRSKILNSEGYKKSMEYIGKYYCHAAVHALENNFLFQSDYLKNNEWLKIRTKDFFETNYQEVDDDDKSVEVILKHDFPCVVHIAFFDEWIREKEYKLKTINASQIENIFLKNKNKVEVPIGPMNYINSCWDSVMWHSLLVVGKNKNSDDLVIWHKIGYNKNFEIDNWKNVYKKYSDCFPNKRVAIGIRPLGNREM